MFPWFRLGVAATLVLISTLSPSQTLSKADYGLTNPETIQVTGHASGSMPFEMISGLSAQDVDGDGKFDLLVTGPDFHNPGEPMVTTLLRNMGNQNFQQVVGNNSSYCVPAYSSPAPPDQVRPFCMLADLNGDGLPDKVFAGSYTNAANSFEVDYPYVKVQFATGPGMSEQYFARRVEEIRFTRQATLPASSMRLPECVMPIRQLARPER